jgi:hypothetical protein
MRNSRFFLAQKPEISVGEMKSAHMPSPTRPGSPEHKHQTDLNTVNAKCRTSDKVDQPDVLLLQQVKQKVGAHKAVVLTTAGFTASAEAAAQDEGIALHIARPNFDSSLLPARNPRSI